MTDCWKDDPQKRPTFQWLCSAIKSLQSDHKVCLEVFRAKFVFYLSLLFHNF